MGPFCIGGVELIAPSLGLVGAESSTERVNVGNVRVLLLRNHINNHLTSFSAPSEHEVHHRFGAFLCPGLALVNISKPIVVNRKTFVSPEEVMSVAYKIFAGLGKLLFFASGANPF